MSERVAHGPIETATSQLLAWLSRTTGVEVTVGAGADQRLNLWPWELRPEQQTRGTGPREPYRFRIVFLLTVAGPEHLGLLDRVLVAAIVAGEPAVILEPPPPELWQALQVTPRPALVIEVPAQVTPPAPDDPLVREPLRLRYIEVRPLDGTVLGPGEMPLAGMRVEVAGTPLHAYTDPHGRFRFAGVPAEERIRLRLHGRQRSMVAEIAPNPDEPVVIHCELEDHRELEES